LEKFFRRQLSTDKSALTPSEDKNSRYAVAKKEKPDMIARVTGVTDV
jgi:hypothetical protein